jgi:NADPH:quinone reductase-like Zn-dependent oxidoreductase
MPDGETATNRGLGPDRYQWAAQTGRPADALRRRGGTERYSMLIADKTVLVTGANRGLGRALVTEALNRAARRVYAAARRPSEHPDERVTPLVLDVTSAAQIRDAAQQAASIDVLVNNAGLALYEELSDRAALERQVAVNLFGTYDVTQAFLPDTAMSAGLDIPKASPESVASGVFDGVEKDKDNIFPDPLSQAIADGWRGGAVKALELQNARFTRE